MNTLPNKSNQYAAGKMPLAIIFLLVIVVFSLAIFGPRSWWQTPDQQAQTLYDRGDYAAAAALFTSSQRRGVALFRGGEFEAATDAFARVNSAEGHFNRGNALVMRGKYAEAVSAYDRALVLKTDWPEAMNNRKIAQLRAEKTKLEGGDMTGGKLAADDVVFDTQKRDSQEGGTEQVEGEQTMSDSELQALWLRRVQTRPADFLRAKFAFQLATQNNNGATQ